MHQVIDIRFGRTGLAGKLSNLMPREFTFRNVQCGSMEGLLQSLKFQDQSKQLEICLLSGHTARKKGSGINWQESGLLWWQGQPIERLDENVYQPFLDEVYRSLFLKNQEAGQDLLATGECVLTHKTGHSNPKETILTEREFIVRLTEIRSILKQQLFGEIE